MTLRNYSSLYLALCVADINNGMTLPFVDWSYKSLPEERFLLWCVCFEFAGVFLCRSDTFLYDKVGELLVRCVAFVTSWDRARRILLGNLTEMAPGLWVTS